VGALPATSAGHVTFGSLNNFCKNNDAVLHLWARVLGAVPGSRLLLRCPEGEPRARIAAILAGRGVTAERVEFLTSVPRNAYLQLYRRIDIGLDPFPYNGITTTCDALAMGVPVLTLPGTRPASRAGLSLLTTLGLPELAADSEEEYVNKAAALAADRPRLTELRATLRARLQASPLMDAPRFARHMEAAYRTMWKRRCGPFSEG
jgi:protein O-GlcNAc transferase